MKVYTLVTTRKKPGTGVRNDVVVGVYSSLDNAKRRGKVGYWSYIHSEDGTLCGWDNGVYLIKEYGLDDEE